MAMPSGSVTSPVCMWWAIDQPIDTSGRGVHHCCAVHLSLARGCSLDIEDPELVRPVDGDIAVDKSVLSSAWGHGWCSRGIGAGTGLDAGPAHEPLDPLAVDRQPEPKRQLVVHPRQP
jgi:hypothetical protein